MTRRYIWSSSGGLPLFRRKEKRRKHRRIHRKKYWRKEIHLVKGSPPWENLPLCGNPNQSPRFPVCNYVHTYILLYQGTWNLGKILRVEFTTWTHVETFIFWLLLYHSYSSCFTCLFVQSFSLIFASSETGAPAFWAQIGVRFVLELIYILHMQAE